MINLLPPERKAAGKFYSRMYALGSVYIVVVVLLGLGAAGLAAFNLRAGSTINERQQKINELTAQRNEHKKETVKAAFIEDRIKLVSKYQEGQDWPTVLDQLDATVPTDVELTSLKMTVDASNTISFSITGVTSDRRSIILFRQKLSGEPSFSNVVLQSITDAKAGNKKTFSFAIGLSFNQLKSKEASK